MFIFNPIYTALVGSDVCSYSSFPPAIHYTSSIPSLSSAAFQEVGEGRGGKGEEVEEEEVKTTC